MSPTLHPFLPQGDHEGDEGVQEWAEGQGGVLTGSGQLLS